jgi:hypothetical protein
MYTHAYQSYWWTTYLCLLHDQRQEKQHPVATDQELQHWELLRMVGIKPFGGMDYSGIECQDGSWMPWNIFYPRYAECQKRLLKRVFWAQIGAGIFLGLLLLGVLVCIKM